MITPVVRQILSDQTNIVYAPSGAPQTQFEAPQSEAQAAAVEAINNYADALKAGFKVIPPAGVVIYPDGGSVSTGAWHDAGPVAFPVPS